MSHRSYLLGSLVGASLLALAAAPAAAQTQTFVDLQAGLGYSTNPLMQLGDDVDSGFGRLSAYGYHGWRGQRSETSLSAYVENNSYLRRYSNKQLFDVTGRTSLQASEKARLFGSLGFSGDFGAQLGSRFFGAPLQTAPVEPPIGTPSTVIVLTPDLAALNRRQYRISGDVGGSFVISPRDAISASVNAQRVFFSGSNDLLDYHGYGATAAWQRRVNERLAVGIRFTADRGDYSRGRSVTTYGPQVIADARLDENLQLSGGIGFVRTERDLGSFGGKDDSVALSFDGSLCRNVEYEQLCASFARRSQSSVIGAAPTSSSVNATYARRLTARDQVQLSLAAVRTDAVRDLGLGRQSYYSASGAYDRKLNDRLSAGVNLVARKLTFLGADPKADLGGSFFIRNRFGDVR